MNWVVEVLELDREYWLELNVSLVKGKKGWAKDFILFWIPLRPAACPVSDVVSLKTILITFEGK